MQTNEPEILYSELPTLHGKLGIITLNRPKALNALSANMALSLNSQLRAWAESPDVMAVIIKSDLDKAFCAGGDLKVVYNHGKYTSQEMIPFFNIEYQLIQYINEYPKPYIAIINGIAMGGGLGLSLHGSRVISTENLQLAMPETAIGFYPDVGAGYFLSHCPNNIGMYLGLTGNTINVADAILCKLVNALIPSNKIADFINTLTKQDLRTNPLATIDSVIENYEQDPGTPELIAQLDIIETCFGENSVENIIEALKKQNSAWAQKQLTILNKRSPTSLKVTFKHLSTCDNITLKECLNIDLNLTLKLFQEHDIYEGIRALLIDKTYNPKWQPETLQEVKDTFIDQLFEITCKL